MLKLKNLETRIFEIMIILANMIKIDLVFLCRSSKLSQNGSYGAGEKISQKH